MNVNADTKPELPVTRAELVAVLEETRTLLGRKDYSGGVCFAIRLASRRVGRRVARRHGCQYESSFGYEEQRLTRGIQWWFRQWFAPSGLGCGAYWWDYPGYGAITKMPRLVALDLALLIARGK